jgi:hypothetical protein
MCYGSVAVCYTDVADMLRTVKDSRSHVVFHYVDVAN